MASDKPVEEKTTRSVAIPLRLYGDLVRLKGSIESVTGISGSIADTIQYLLSKYDEKEIGELYEFQKDQERKDKKKSKP